MFADSRDPDLRRTSETAYIEVDFQKNTQTRIKEKITKQDDPNDEFANAFILNNCKAFTVSNKKGQKNVRYEDAKIKKW
jgi:hypothetical protein